MAYGVLRASGIPRWRRRAGSGALVLGFHNVVADDLAGRVGDRALHVGVSAFGEYVDWIKRHYDVIPIGELVDRLRASRPVGGVAAITFDDGYAGVVRHAVPVMRSAGVPFAVFPVIRHSDERKAFWWDTHELTDAIREHAVQTLRGDQDLIDRHLGAGQSVHADLHAASWDELRSMLGADCTIGIHSVTHRNMATLTAEELVFELGESRRRLADELGGDPRIVAFPYGWGSPLVVDEVRRESLDAALTLHFGLNGRGQSIHAIRRVAIPAGLRMSTFACWAAGLRLTREDMQSLLLGQG
jgi:peptidoglycan/xylan/chitin deacetylase (PgdA/CDA1 family)